MKQKLRDSKWYLQTLTNRPRNNQMKNLSSESLMLTKVCIHVCKCPWLHQFRFLFLLRKSYAWLSFLLFVNKHALLTLACKMIWFLITQDRKFTMDISPASAKMDFTSHCSIAPETAAVLLRPCLAPGLFPKVPITSKGILLFYSIK